MSANAIAILFVVFLVVFIIVVRIVLKKMINKTSDSIRNKIIDKQEQNNPPQQENLADRFNNVNNEWFSDN